MSKNIENSIHLLASDVASSKGLELVETEIKKMGGRDVVTVYINKPDGISVDDCANVSKGLDVLLEAEGVMPGPYTLEVSSPGLTRPLKGRTDFEKKIGEEIRVKFYGQDNKVQSVIGQLLSVDDEQVILLVNRASMEIKLNSIKSAKINVTI